MLYTYAPNPAASNWLQEVLLALVREALQARLDKRDARVWRQALPAAHLAELASRWGLKRRYEALVEASSTLSEVQLQDQLDVVAQGHYASVLAGKSYCPVSGVSAEYEDALKEFSAFAFDLLGELDNKPADGRSIRDALYYRAYSAMPEHVCPFCGYERFDAPREDMPRHPLDHYLPISLYPLFGAHLPNLVPMCGRCNSSFKLAADILIDDAGLPRPCVDPYGGAVAQISLSNSTPFGDGPTGQDPVWVVDFIPADPAFETWDAVFKIRHRYRENLLKAEYRAWLGVFGRWAADLGVPIDTAGDASAALRRWASLMPGLGDQGFVKRPMFEMLADSALRPDAVGDRVTALIKSICANA